MPYGQSPDRSTAQAPSGPTAQTLSCPTAQTLSYYDANARQFVASTADVEFSAMQDRFTTLLAPGAKILDFGCGSGRDAKSFLEAGFDVTATDGSAELWIGNPFRDIFFRD